MRFLIRNTSNCFIGVKWCWNTHTNTIQCCSMSRKAKLRLSLVWQSQLPFVKRVRLFSYQFPSEMTLQRSVKAYIWNALRSFPREQHSKSLEFYLKAKCHIWTVTLQKLLCFIVRHQIFWESLWYSHWSCIDTPLGSRWWILR